MEIFEREGPLNYKTLKARGLFATSDSAVTMEYQKCKVDGYEGIFIGQHKNKGPNGLIRLISKYGGVIEGFATDGSFNGFRRVMSYNGNCVISYLKNGKREGNRIYINKDSSINENRTGFYLNNDKQGPLKKDHFTYVEAKDIVKNGKW